MNIFSLIYLAIFEFKEDNIFDDMMMNFEFQENEERNEKFEYQPEKIIDEGPNFLPTENVELNISNKVVPGVIFGFNFDTYSCVHTNTNEVEANNESITVEHDTDTETSNSSDDENDNDTDYNDSDDDNSDDAIYNVLHTENGEIGDTYEEVRSLTMF